MAIVVHFIRDYAPWIYGACVLIALWYLRVAILARRERRYAVFALERETALNRTYGAWTVAVALIIVIAVVYVLSTVVSDAVAPLVEEEPLPTPIVVTPAVQPTNTLPVPEITPTATFTPRPRPTSRPQPTLGPTVPATPNVVAPRCPDSRAVITSPGVGAAISGMTPIYGTATHEQFKYYKLEYGAGTEPAVWSYFDGGEAPVQNGRLGALNAGALAPGTYAVRVIVVDVTGNFPPPCQTIVVVR